MKTEVQELLKGIAAGQDLNIKDIFKEFPEILNEKFSTEKLMQVCENYRLEYKNLKGDHSERLKVLRRALKSKSLDGLIVPKADEFQGEYIAKRSERLLWLSGFSGSAGQAIVLAKTAALFVDGRYTLQANDEVDKSSYVILPLASKELENWLSHNLIEGNKIAFDPWIHSEREINFFTNICANKKVHLVGIEENLIDSIWLNQPPKPISLCRTHDLTYSGVTSIAKRKTLSKKLKKTNTDVLIISSPDSIAWLLNIRGKDVPFNPFILSYVFFFKNSSLDWFVDSRKLTKSLLEKLDPKIKIKTPESMGSRLKSLVSNSKVFHVCSNTTPFYFINYLKQNGGLISRGLDPCQSLKACKNITEISGTRNAHLRDGVAVTKFICWLSKSGMTAEETEISAGIHLEKQRKKQEKFQEASFPTICGYGANGAIVHYQATPKTNKQIRPGSLCLIDSGGQYLDGTTDITRTIAIGKPSKEMKLNFTLVLKGHIAIATSRFPSDTTGSQLDILARQFLWKFGLDYHHGTGHGVGSYLSVHEGPQRISKTPSDAPLQPGMIISNEPGYYKAGKYGIRIENLVLVTLCPALGENQKEFLEFETLSLAPIDLNLVDLKLMSLQEINWLNTYHKLVKEKLSPLLDAETKAWLKIATSPIRYNKLR